MMELIMDNSFVNVIGATPQEHEVVKLALTYRAKGWYMIKKRMQRQQPGNPYWDNYEGYHSLYTKDRFHTGLLPQVVKALLKNEVPHEVIDRRTKPLVSPVFDSKMLRGIELYDFQIEAVRDFLKAKRGIAQLPTGAGKTEVAIACAKALNLPTIFMTHRVNLLHQTAERFLDRWPELKGRIAIIGDGDHWIRAMNKTGLLIPDRRR